MKDRAFKLTLQSSFARSWAAVVIGAVLTAGLGYLLHDFRIGRALSNLSCDLLPVLRGDAAANEAVLVYLDERSHRELGQPFNAPWDRALHARLIERLTRAGAKAIVFDIVFNDPAINNPGADQLLAQAMKASGRVILGADNVPIGPKERKILRPFDLLLDSAAGLGSTEVVPSPDLVVRIHTPEAQLPSLSWTVAEFLGVKVTTQEGQQEVERWINYYGPPGSLAWKSYVDALDPGRASDDFFRGKVVFVGARIITKFSGERKDEYRSPFSYWIPEDASVQADVIFISGVEIQATAFLNLLRGDWLRRLPFTTERALMLVLGACLGAMLVLFRPVIATGLALAGWLLSTLVFYFLYLRGLIWVPWLIVWAQIFVALCWSVLFNSIQLYVQKRVSDHTLSLYLPPKLVRRFSGDPRLLKPGATKQVVTLFFSDIASFTSLAEGLDSDDLAHLMNHYFEAAVSQCIHRTEGTVVKYIGDAIFAFWNAPEPQPDHGRRACEAALYFREDAVQIVKGRHLQTRIGLHTGLANVGNFGSLDRVDYTAIGESVNLASRLEGLNKYLGTRCVMSGATRRTIGDTLITRELGLFRLKGLEKPVEVYELVGWPGEAESTQALRAAFAAALGHYRQRNWSEAQAGFRRSLELSPTDGPAQFYLTSLSRLRPEELPQHWAGEVELTEK